MRMRRLGHLLLTLLTATGAAACDRDLTRPADQSAGDRREAQLAEAASGNVLQAGGRREYKDRSAGAASSLEEFESAVTMLDPGQCLLEYGRADGRWLRFVRTLTHAGSGTPLPFAVDYRLPGRRVVYRATCNVALADRDSAMAAVSWAPGNGEFAAGQGWRNVPSTGAKALPSGVIAAAASIAGYQDPLAGYYHYDWCYVLIQGGEIIEVLYCGYDTESCEEGQHLDGPTGECVIPGGPGGNGSDGPGGCDPSEEICPEPVLVVECDNLTLQRGTTISCTASVTEGGSMSDLTWSFTYEGGTLTDLGSSNPIVGTMAVSGTLHATAAIDGGAGPPGMASVSISITARDWSAKKWPFEVVPKGSQGMPAQPTHFSQLGWFYAVHNSLPNVAGTINTIPSGPNAGIAYLTDMPELDVEGNVHVNYAALSPPSAFLDRQTGPPYCTASQVNALIPLIEAHEGLSLCGFSEFCRGFSLNFVAAG